MNINTKINLTINALYETQRYIDKEEKMPDDNRPTEVQKNLESYRKRKEYLIGKLREYRVLYRYC